jgi:hypothetical protein
MAQGDPEPLNPYRYMYRFINNVYADFLKATLDYFGTYLYPFDMKVVATYDKAVEYLQKQAELEGRELDKLNRPALIMNPSGELDVADALAAGRFLWRHPNLMPGFIKYIFDPIYQDENTLINVGFLRMKGTIELLALCESFYEYCDIRLLWIQVFGGLDRWIYPKFFSSFIILPEELINFRYTNPYTGKTYTLDWENNGAYEYLVRSTARNELVFPAEIKPIYKLTGLGDNSDRYGGTDSIADWRATASIEYEIEIPAYLVLESDYLAEKIDINIKYGSVYSIYPMHEPPVNRIQYKTTIDWGLEEEDGSTFTGDSTCETELVHDYIFNTRYYHIVDSVQLQDSTATYNITIPETIDDKSALIVNGPAGELQYGDHWILQNNKTILAIKLDTVNLQPRMVLELYVYKRLGP